MRTAHKLTLLATLAIAATALASTLAFAQVEPLAHNQTPRLIVQQEVHAANDVNCPPVVPTPAPSPGPLVTGGGCRNHVISTGAVSLSAHLSAGGTEVVIGQCNIEYDTRVDVAGEGYVSHQELTGGASCTKRACGQASPPTGEGRAYSFFTFETEPDPRERTVVLFCIENLDGSQPSHCEITLPVSSSALHRARMTANDVTGHGAIFPHCEVTGTFDAEAAPGSSGEAQAYQNIEVRHT